MSASDSCSPTLASQQRTTVTRTSRLLCGLLGLSARLVTALMPGAAAAEEAAVTGLVPTAGRPTAPYAAPPPPAALPPSPPPPPVVLLPAAPPSPFEPDETSPLAGYTYGAPFIRSRDGNFVLFPSGRLNVDGAFFPVRGDAPAGEPADSPGDNRPRNTFFVRRARAEITGTIFKHFDYMLAGEFATTPGGVQSTTVTDVFVNVNYTSWANLQVGQFDAPFTLENRTSDKYIDFMERSITVRSFGVPSNKETGIMLVGMAPSRFLHYELGVFNGDGLDVRNPDSHFDVIGRAYLAPLALLSRASSSRWLSEIWFGGSVWYGQRVESPYTAPVLTTQGGVTLLPSTFNGNQQLTPNGTLFKWAVELNVPIGPLGWRFELVHTDRENLGLYKPAGTDPAPSLGRILAGSLNRSGTALYVQMWYWILGSPTILPTPGQEIPTHWAGYRRGKEQVPIGLYLSARYERLVLHQDDVSQAPLMLTSAEQGATGSLTVDSFGLALNAWFTKHVRFSANYLLNYVDGDIGIIQPGVKLPPPSGTTGQPTSIFYRTPEHEVMLRAAIGI